VSLLNELLDNELLMVNCRIVVGINSVFDVRKKNMTPSSSQGSGLARSYGSSIFSFCKEPPYCPPLWLLAIYTPTNITGGFPFLQALSHICYL